MNQRRMTMTKQISSNTFEYTTEELIKNGTVVYKKERLGGDLEENIPQHIVVIEKDLQTEKDLQKD